MVSKSRSGDAESKKTAVSAHPLQRQIVVLVVL